jgi:hypothetical protein
MSMTLLRAAASFSSSSGDHDEIIPLDSKPRTISAAGTSLPVAQKHAADSRIILLMQQVRADAMAFSGRLQRSGIDEKIRDRIFEVKLSGSGLGLATVKSTSLKRALQSTSSEITRGNQGEPVCDETRNQYDMASSEVYASLRAKAACSFQMSADCRRG